MGGPPGHVGDTLCTGRSAADQAGLAEANREGGAHREARRRDEDDGQTVDGHEGDGRVRHDAQEEGNDRHGDGVEAVDLVEAIGREGIVREEDVHEEDHGEEILAEEDRGVIRWP
jgi:hypothetical protein